jgi:hypothetical protein
MHPIIHSLNSQERSRDLIARAETSRLARAGRLRLTIWERLRRRRSLVTRPTLAQMPPPPATPPTPRAADPVGHESANGRAASMRL